VSYDFIAFVAPVKPALADNCAAAREGESRRVLGDEIDMNEMWEYFAEGSIDGRHLFRQFY